MLKKIMDVVRGTVYTKCVCAVPIAELDADLPLNVENSYGRCNRNVVYKMCMHRSYCSSRYRSSLEYLKQLRLL